MTYLIIPDIHLKHSKAEKIIQSVKADKVVFLGDIFHEFGDTAEQTKESAEWLKQSLNDRHRIFLWGNHDIVHAYTFSYTLCTGFDRWKHDIIFQILDKDDWNKFRFHYILDDKWLMTHAGLHPYYIRMFLDTGRDISLNKIDEWLIHEETKALHELNNKKAHWIYGAGFVRRGRLPYGGILWLDHNSEFKPISGINQLYGHTTIRNPARPSWHIMNKNGKHIRHDGNYTENQTDKSVNLCLDTELEYFATWSGKKLIIGKYSDL
jgi:hypothetical protein